MNKEPPCAATGQEAGTPRESGSETIGAGSAQSRVQARLAALVAASSDVVYAMNADWSEMQPVSGRGLVASNDAPVRDWLERNVPAGEHARVRAAIARSIAGKSVFDLEHRVIGPDGAENWTHSRAVPILDDAGEIVEWFGVARDVTATRHAQEALRDSEQRFRSVFEQATAGIAQVDLDGRFVLVNDRYCEIVGRSREELFTLRMQELTHPDDLAENLTRFADAVQGGSPSFMIEKRYLRPDGAVVWVHNAVSANRGPDGEVRYITAVSTDITRLRAAEDEHATLAAQRQLALDAARLGWWQYDPASGLVMHDARYAEIYGLSGDSPRPVEDINHLLHPDDAARLWEAVEAASDPAVTAPYAVEYRIIRPDGAVRWLEARGIVSFEGKGTDRRPSSFVGAVADVTDRHLAEDVLRKNEARFRLMADASPAVLWLTDPDGRCTFLSREWYEFTGQTQDEALGLGWTDAAHPDDREAAGRTFMEANAARSFLRTEYRLRRADGSYRWAVDLGRPWYSESGEYAGMVGAVFDIDDRKRAEQGLEEASRRKDQFLATLAHELRNPLAPISNALQVWARVEDRPEEARRLRQMMERQLRQMVRLIDDLLDVSRITRGRIELRRERVALSAVLEAAVESLQPFIETRRHVLQVAMPDQPLFVDADPGRLTQVFGNLLHNAAKYTNPGGHIWLSLRRDGKDACASIRDDGCGIPPEMLDPVFDMFVQVDQTLGRSHGGLGIGLTLVRNLVELHGGKVQVSSAGTGHGTEVVVRLPAVDDDRPDQTGLRARGALPPPPRRRVLVVDDAQWAGDTLAMMLQELGQETRTVYCGADAVDAADAYRPQVAFVDIAMPGMDGFEVVRHLRTRLGDAAVLVALTGYGQEEDRQRAFAAGFDHHLVKPTSLEALHGILLAVPE